MQLTFQVTPYEQNEYLHAVTYLPIKKWRYLLPFAHLNYLIIRQLRASSGVVCFTVYAQPLKRVFWTHSVWTDEASMRDFVQQEPHARAMRYFGKWSGNNPAFAQWTSTNAALNWQEALSHL